MKCNPANRVPGTKYEKPSDTESAKQLQERMAKMNMERAKQDKMWTPVEPETKNAPNK
jgi:hypothetical protein